MAISDVNTYLTAAKQIINHTKVATTTTSAGSIRYTNFAASGGANGYVPAGTLAGTATPGALFTPAITGFPAINFSTGSGYITRIQYSNSVTGRIELWDKIYGVAVSLTTLGTTTVTSPPSITGRLINGNDYASLRLFVEITTTVSATATTVQVTYTDQGGTSRAATATASLSNFTAGRWVEIPLVAGSTGIQKIESVVIGGTVATAGAVNIIIARLLWCSPRINIAPGGDVHGIDKTGMPQIFPTSALAVTIIPEGTSTGTVDLAIEVTNA